MTILALDLGTKTGFAFFSPPHAVISGTWNLAPTRHESEGMRYVKFMRKLKEMHAAAAIDEVAYESVERHAGTVAAHVYGGLMAFVKAFCIENKIEYRGVSVGTIKKSFTGKGNADKTAMMAEAARRGYTVGDSNEADALALLDYVLKEKADG